MTFLVSFGTRGSEVQILSPRPFPESSTYGISLPARNPVPKGQSAQARCGVLWPSRIGLASSNIPRHSTAGPRPGHQKREHADAHHLRFQGDANLALPVRQRLRICSGFRNRKFSHRRPFRFLPWLSRRSTASASSRLLRCFRPSALHRSSRECTIPVGSAIFCSNSVRPELAAAAGSRRIFKACRMSVFVTTP